MYVEARQRLVDWLERQLIGPAVPNEERRDEIDMSPLDRYPVGVLHPLESEERGVDPASRAEVEEGGAGDPVREEDSEEVPRDGEPGGSGRKAQPVRRRRYVPPSSVGFSFCVRGESRLRIQVSAAVYLQRTYRAERGRLPTLWPRRTI